MWSALQNWSDSADGVMRSRHCSLTTASTQPENYVNDTYFALQANSNISHSPRYSLPTLIVCNMTSELIIIGGTVTFFPQPRRERSGDRLDRDRNFNIRNGIASCKKQQTEN